MTTSVAPWIHAHTFSVAAPPERVFHALTDRAELTRWFAEHVEVGDRPGGPYRFWGRHTLGAPAAQDARGTLTAFEPARALGFTWPLRGTETRVRLDLAPDADGAATKVAVTHEVDGDLGGARQRELIDDHWRLAFGNLSSHLAGGDGVLLVDYDDPAPEVRVTITIAAPPAVVFRTLLEPERVNRWFQSKGAVIEPRAGGRYELGWKYQMDGREVTGGPTRILELVPDERLVLDWPDWRGDAAVTGQTIAFHLEPAPGGSTRLTFVHAGFGRPADVSDYPFGWRWFLGELRTVAESADA